MPKKIAVDFDGTLCEYAFPKIGNQTPEQKELLELLIELKKEGHKIILWTNRGDNEEYKVLTEAVDWCRSKGLEFDAVNENLIEPIFIGDEKEILKCAEELKWDISNYEIIHEPVENNTAAIAAKLASEQKIRIIVKGHIHTDVLMKEVLKR